MWDERYSEAGFAYGTEANDFLKEEFHRIPKGGRVLCIAEGEGRNAVFLAQNGYQVTAMDLSDYALGVEQWDGIISIWAHLPDAIRQRLHTQVAPALKQDGVFILEAYTYEQTTMKSVGGPPATQQELFMSLQKLQPELAALKKVVAIEKHRSISEGMYHHGLSAVVQFVGVKE